jgi:hypothetical protein
MTWAAYGPSWAAYGPQNPSDDGIRWHDMSENANQPSHVLAGQDLVGAGDEGRPQQDSNLRSRLRRPFVQSIEFVSAACPDSTARLPSIPDHSVHIPYHGNFLVAARTLQGMARVRSGQAPAWPWFLTGVAAEAPGSSVTSRVRLPGTFHPCLLSCGHCHV